MGLNAPAQWIVCYDMAERRRLARVFKLLKGHGIPLQRSVFLVHASALSMAQLRTQLASLLDAKEDDVRAYRLPEGGYRMVLGQPLIPQGMLPGAGAETWLALPAGR